MHKLNLSQPIPLIINKNQISAPTKFAQQPFLELLIEEDRKPEKFKKFRYVIGKIDIKLSLDDMWDLIIFFLPKSFPTIMIWYSGESKGVLTFLANLARGLFIYIFLT